MTGWGATEYDLQVLSASRPNPSQQCSIAARMANLILGSISSSHQTRELLYSALVGSYLKEYILRPSRHEKNGVTSSEGQQDNQRLEDFFYEEEMKKPKFFRMERKWSWEDLKAAFLYL